MKTNKKGFKRKSRTKGIWIVLASVVLSLSAIGGYLWYRNYQEEQLAIKRKEEVEAMTQEYLTSFSDGDFDSLIAHFTPESIEERGYTEAELVERYSTVYDGIGATDIVITNQALSYVERTDTYDLIYSVNMNTALGPLTGLNFHTSIYETDTENLVEWDYSLLFPNMEEGDTVSLSYTHPKRGSIYDRNGNMLAGEGEAWEAGLYPRSLGEGEERASRLQTISDTYSISVERLEALLDQAWVTEESFVPFQVVDETPEVPGVLYQKTVERVYPLREAAAHLVGYVGEVTAEDIENDAELRAGQLIGKTGLESIYENQLRGNLGGEIAIVDSHGEIKEIILEREKEDGESLYLTIDSVIQENLYRTFEEEPGSAAMMHPQTGDFLALVSSPSYDPQLFVRGISQTDYDTYLNDEDSPFLNRYAARYVPGSTFKILSAMVLLENGVTTPDTIHTIEGLQWSPETPGFGDHQITRVNDTVSEVDLETALVLSDNIFFAMEALEMGADAFEEALSVFPFGEPLDWPFEMSAAQFSNENTIDNDVLLADTAYGQGEILMNAIHQLVFYSPVLNDGALVQPNLLRDSDTSEPTSVISAESASTVESLLLETVTQSNGTANKLSALPYAVGAKTGTSEIAGEEGNETNGLLYVFDAEGYDYSFIAHLEGQRGGDVIDRFLPFLSTVKNEL